MRGPEVATTLVKDALEDRLPAKLVELNARLALAGTEVLGPPALYATEVRAQLDADDFPAIQVVAQDARSLKLVAVEDGSEVYAVTYALRTFLWVRDQEYPEVTRRRDRMALAMREVILEALTLSDAEGGAVVNPETLRESYAEPANDSVGRSIAASYLELEVTIEERIARTTGPEAVTSVIVGANAGADEPLEHPALAD